MYTINELEFIGESLPKINENFTELNSNIAITNSKVTSLINLSAAFYTNNASNYNTNIVEIDLTTPPLPDTQIFKTNITELSSSNIIYPISIYLTISYGTLPDSTITFSYIDDDGIPTLLSEGDYLIEDKNQLFTFQDSGFNNWKLDFPDTPNQAILRVVYRTAN